MALAAAVKSIFWSWDSASISSAALSPLPLPAGSLLMVIGLVGMEASGPRKDLSNSHSGGVFCRPDPPGAELGREVAGVLGAAAGEGLVALPFLMALTFPRLENLAKNELVRIK